MLALVFLAAFVLLVAPVFVLLVLVNFFVLFVFLVVLLRGFFVIVAALVLRSPGMPFLGFGRRVLVIFTITTTAGI